MKIFRQLILLLFAFTVLGCARKEPQTKTKILESLYVNAKSGVTAYSEPYQKAKALFRIPFKEKVTIVEITKVENFQDKWQKILWKGRIVWAPRSSLRKYLITLKEFIKKIRIGMTEQAVTKAISKLLRQDLLSTELVEKIFLSGKEFSVQFKFNKRALLESMILSRMSASFGYHSRGEAAEKRALFFDYTALKRAISSLFLIRPVINDKPYKSYYSKPQSCPISSHGIQTTWKMKKSIIRLTIHSQQSEGLMHILYIEFFSKK